jgi:hypothetical protein
VRQARALDAISHNANADVQDSPEQMRDLMDARSAFEKVRPYGWRDTEAAYVKISNLSAGRGPAASAASLLLLASTWIRVVARAWNGIGKGRRIGI